MSYADLLKTVKREVDKEELGEILSIKKGSSEELHIRVKGLSKYLDSKYFLGEPQIQSDKAQYKHIKI